MGQHIYWHAPLWEVLVAILISLAILAWFVRRALRSPNLEQALWQPLLVRRITFAVDGTCVQDERRSPYGELLFHDADTRR
ncbi:MAG: hypothetical protein U9R15_04850 [Chloroflexota bacterium]|nr:hypothetical protein [Chloroflexota bacterium]